MERSEPVVGAGAVFEEAATVGTPAPRQRLLLDFNWRFHFGNAADQSRDFGYGEPRREGSFAKASYVAPVGEQEFDDSAWRLLDLPHDWAVELPFIASEKTYREGDEAKLINCGEGRKPVGRDFPETSIGWYRRKINLPPNSAGKRVFIEFDGVFRDAVVLFNNHYLGRNFSGYAPFAFDVTDYLHEGKPNQLAVRVDATLSEGWFYEGTGIYRHVWLTITEPVHVPQWGTFIVTTPNGNASHVSISTEVANCSEAPQTVTLSSAVLDATGTAVLTLHSEPHTIAPWEQTSVQSQGILRAPAMWSCELPYLHRAVTSVRTAAAERIG